MKLKVRKQAHRFLLITSLAALLGACTPEIQTRYITTELTHPPRPILPRVKAAEMKCPSKEAYQKLYDRQRLTVEYSVTLEAIIESTGKTKESVELDEHTKPLSDAKLPK